MKQPGTRIRFGPFELNVSNMELRKHGVRVRVQEQPLRVLMALLENPGNTICREELVRRIWPSDTFVEFEHGLNAAVNRLRQVLGDSVQRPRYIETVSRRGYCFIGEVSLQPDAVSPPSVSVRENKGSSAPEAAPAKQAPERSLVVLPFVDLSPKTESTFADGLAEEIINALTRVPGLRVIARASASLFRDRALPLREIACRLNASLVLDGTIRTAHKRIRVTAQLIDGAEEICLWSDRYDRDLTDLFDLQEDLAQAILHALELRMTDRRLVRRYTRDQEAHLFYLKGIFYTHKWTPEAISQICAYMRRVTEMEPQYAPAWVEMAHALFGQAMAGAPPAQILPGALEAAHRAVTADPNLAEARAVLGLLKGVYQYDWRGALAEFEAAIQLNQPAACVHFWHALILTALGRTEAALSELHRSLQADPFSVLANMHLCRLYTVIGDFDRAISYGERAVEVGPRHFPAFGRLGEAWMGKGDVPKGITWLEQSRSLTPAEGWYTATLAAAYQCLGRSEEAERILAEVERKAHTAYVPAAVLAFVSAAVGEADGAFGYFEQAVADRDGILLFVQTELSLRSIRGDPRYQHLLHAMKLRPQHASESHFS